MRIWHFVVVIAVVIAVVYVYKHRATIAGKLGA